MGQPTVSSDRTLSGRFSTTDTPDGDKRRHTPTKRRLLFTKPIFDGEIFYLDVPGYNGNQQLEIDILQLGGKIEKFLSKDITCVVTNNKRTTNKKCSTSSTPVSSSPMAMLSRGRALMLKASAASSPKVSDILGRAEEMGIKIKTLGILVKQIEIEKSKCKSNDRTNDVDAIKGPAKKNKIRKLKPSFVKVEHVSCKYSPQFNTFKSFPSISMDFSLDENEITRTHQGSPFEPYAPSACNSAKAALTNATKAKATAKKSNKTQAARGGYCECCDQHYKDCTQHAKSLKHRSFVANKENFTLLDSLLQSITSVEDLVKSYSQMDGTIDKSEKEHCLIASPGNENDKIQENNETEMRSEETENVDPIKNEFSAEQSPKETKNEIKTVGFDSIECKNESEAKIVTTENESQNAIKENVVAESGVIEEKTDNKSTVVHERVDTHSLSKKIENCIAAVIDRSVGKHVDSKVKDMKYENELCDMGTEESASIKLVCDLSNSKTVLAEHVCDSNEAKTNHKGPNSPVSVDTDELAETTSTEKDSHDTYVNGNENMINLENKPETKVEQSSTTKEEQICIESPKKTNGFLDIQQNESNGILPEVDLDIEMQDLASMVPADLFDNVHVPLEFPEIKNGEEFSIHDLLVGASKSRISTEHESFSDFSSEVQPNHDLHSIIERLDEENEGDIMEKSTQIKMDTESLHQRNDNVKLPNAGTFCDNTLQPLNLPQNKPVLNANDYWKDWSKPCDDIKEFDVSKLYPKWSTSDGSSNSEMEKENMPQFQPADIFSQESNHGESTSMPQLQPVCLFSKENMEAMEKRKPCSTMPQLQQECFLSSVNMHGSETNMPQLQPACLFPNENVQSEEKNMPQLEPVCLFPKQNNPNISSASPSHKIDTKALQEKESDVSRQESDSEDFIDVCSISMDKNNNTSNLNSSKLGDLENIGISAKNHCIDNNKVKGGIECKVNPPMAESIVQSSDTVTSNVSDLCQKNISASSPKRCQQSPEKFLNNECQQSPEKCDMQKDTQNYENCDKDSETRRSTYDKQQACSNFRESLLQKDPYAFTEDSNESWLPRCDDVISPKQSKIYTPKRQAQIENFNYGQWAATPTSQLKLKLKRVVLTPKTTDDSLKNQWSVHRSGDCKLVFSAGSSRKRNRKSISHTASKDTKRRRLDFNK